MKINKCIFKENCGDYPKKCENCHFFEFIEKDSFFEPRKKPWEGLFEE